MHAKSNHEHSEDCKHFNKQPLPKLKLDPPYCEDARTPFDPDRFFDNWSDDQYIPSGEKTFKKCICAAFDLDEADTYMYKAFGATHIGTVQAAINAKRKNDLHLWYHNPQATVDEGAPSLAEIDAYISIFSPSVNLHSALKRLGDNAKPASIRSRVAANLLFKFFNSTNLLPSNSKKTSKRSKKKRSHVHVNPYFSFWAWSCRELEWAGPVPNTQYTIASHHLLPLFYHHFGCVVPSYHALMVIARLAQTPDGKSVFPILDIGSGNGYWTYMLRRFPLEPGMNKLDVRAVDNQTSEYRVMWIRDTINASGADWITNEYYRKDITNNEGKDAVLLLVYPQAKGNFTGPVLNAFKGDKIVLAGTQNDNRFTAFDKETVEAWMEKEKPDFELKLRIPLPSFAGKDDALFVWERRK
ncbi:hypothetical protein K469DRAFT_548427 [Zopfia rhizophila CBS 207.26]|uniref:Uncharacterized protein n=1 Tax=Zopfia rhizophila CBS 207.26 TaxID=1314779 RepID=A0A6A6EWC3_9PEZI|nr:hypothetical protein K469DRAFT_548427 [Zopfia rhizophila CBS 207.26]